MTSHLAPTAALARPGASRTVKPEPPPVIVGISKTAARHSLAGYGVILATCVFMRWAIEQTHFPTVEAVQTRFNVCRATAYRWTAALAEAYGLDPAKRHGGRRK